MKSNLLPPSILPNFVDGQTGRELYNLLIYVNLAFSKTIRNNNTQIYKGGAVVILTNGNLTYPFAGLYKQLRFGLNVHIHVRLIVN